MPCLGIVFLFSFSVIPAIHLNPTVGITDEHLFLFTLWGAKKAIAWEDIMEIRPPKLGLFPVFFRRITNRKKILIVKGKNLGFLYRLYGFMYDGGGQGFLLNPKIKQYSELVDKINIQRRFS